jgi:hypothetical protein
VLQTNLGPKGTLKMWGWVIWEDFVKFYD